MANYVKVGIESAFGSVSSEFTGLLVTSVNDTVERGQMIEETISDYLPRSAYGGALQPSGSIEAILRAVQCENLISSLMGSYTTLGSTRTYTFGEPDSFSLKIGEDSSEQKEITYIGCGISSVDLAFEAKDFVKATFNWIGKDVQNTTSGFAEPTYTNEQPIVFYRATVTIDGDSSIGIKSLSMNIDRGLDTDQFVLGSFKRYRLARTSQTSTSGSLTFTENEFDEMLKAMFGEATNLTIPANNQLGTGSMIIECLTVDGSSALTITCPIAIYNNVSRSFSGKTEIEKTVDYTIISDPDTPFSIAITTVSSDTLGITSITPTPSSGSDPLTVSFEADVTGDPTYFKWDFDDGEVSYEESPTHVFSGADTYTVTLTIDKMGADRVSDTTSITVS